MNVQWCVLCFHRGAFVTLRLRRVSIYGYFHLLKAAGGGTTTDRAHTLLYFCVVAEMEAFIGACAPAEVNICQTKAAVHALVCCCVVIFFCTWMEVVKKMPRLLNSR